MTPDQITDYLRSEMPLTAAMQIRVAQQTPTFVEITAPLAPNLNLHGTAFAGSLATLSLISGWTLIYGALRDAGIEAELFAQKSTCTYVAPATTDLRSTAHLSVEAWTGFVAQLRSKGRARMEAETQIHSGDTLAVTHVGTYAAKLK